MRRSWQRLRDAGFTLVEVIAVTVIGSFIAVVAVSSLCTVSHGREKLDTYSQVADELRRISEMMRTDLSNIYRDRQAILTKFEGEVLAGGAGQESRLTFYAVNHDMARPGGKEGDVYEIEYRLLENDGAYRLVRRLWPHAHPLAEPGGVVYPIAENIIAFVASYFDGQQWQDTWMPTTPALPQIVRVALIAKFPDENRYLESSFMVYFPRQPQQPSSEEELSVDNIEPPEFNFNSGSGGGS